MRPPEDYAVVVGISHYPKLGSFGAANRDARAFAQWLTASPGGSLPTENVTLLVDNDVPSREQEEHPTREDVEAAFTRLLSGGRRLYIYMAGHGFRTRSGQLGLLMANASPQSYQHSIIPVAYADYMRAAGKFDELVLFVDCDWSTHHDIEPVRPAWDNPTSHQQDREVSTLYGFAARDGSIAMSSDSDAVGVHSLFTDALLEALRGKAAGPNGVINAANVHAYVRTRVIERSSGRQTPNFITSGSRAILFGYVDTRPEDGKSGMPAKEQEKPLAERVRTHADNPAIVDELSRRPFAEVIGSRIDEAWKAEKTIDTSSKTARAFLVHIHGQWGAGKTSVLNFLRAYLQDENRSAADKWIVINFDAWRYQHMRPPWWTLIREIYAQSVQQLRLRSSLKLRLHWLYWRLRADWFPVAIALILFGTAFALVTINVPADLAAIDKSSNQITGSENAVYASWLDRLTNVAKPFQVVSVALTALAGILVLSRSLVFGSARAAQMYVDLRSDPLRAIIKFFRTLVRSLDRPLAVFIDDLDRCERKYVVELLEGIQTLFREVPIVYVVTADRKWICSSFEKSYEEFVQTIDSPGRPLGYLFLDKLFQISVPLPHVSPETRRGYWKALLRAVDAGQSQSESEIQKQAEREAMQSVSGALTQEELEDRISEVAGDPVQESAMRAAAAKQITSAEVLHETEHRLRRFADLLEPNPRSMKRLVNAFGLRQATHILEGRSAPPDSLALWTIIEQRWPLLVDLLAARPQVVSEVAAGNLQKDQLPANLHKLLESDELKAVILRTDDQGNVILREAAIQQVA